MNLENLKLCLNSPSKIAMARMHCLGVDTSSLGLSLDAVETKEGTSPHNPCIHKTNDSSPTTKIMIIQGGLASSLVRLLYMANQEWKIHLPFPCHIDGFFFMKHKTPENIENTAKQQHNDGKNKTTNMMDALNIMHQVLLLLLQVCKLDPTLTEEMAKGCGMHSLLSNILRIDVYNILDELHDPSIASSRQEYETLEDALIAIQDLAAQLAHVDTTVGYPVKVSPFTLEELQARLPLVFTIVSPSGKRKECFMVHQVTERQSAQEDVGFVMWPSAVVLASWLLDQEDELWLVKSGGRKRVLEIGAGCGLTGMVAARMMMAGGGGGGGGDESEGGLAQVILTDFHRKVLMNIQRNISLNGLDDVAKVMHLDFYSHSGATQQRDGWKGTELSLLLQDHAFEAAAPVLDQDHHHDDHHHQMDNQPPVDLILAADTICKASDSVAVSDTIYHALVPGGEAIVVSADAQHRFGVDIFEKECRRNGLQVTSFNVADLCHGRLMPGSEDLDPCGIRQTSGYVDGMTLTMFRVVKPLL
eukprot:CAMPEP_0176502650 /NCGR_PEP_ID=MMETSP0200_2-20121128/14872_1 /TAXON_ID=947934 /ORGANISM="Chaetoceros sp., Strain GSL56" /LENGTH=529 /DNA_ID=CAMNT_0017901747 /DNA_START=417 /DNA_END=2006 /DNA_ORIENTATION=-